MRAIRVVAGTAGADGAGAFHAPLRITHTLADMVRARILAIACGYEDADDLDALRVDPAFKLACGRLPDTGANLVRSRRCRGWRTRLR